MRGGLSEGVGSMRGGLNEGVRSIRGGLSEGVGSMRGALNQGWVFRRSSKGFQKVLINYSERH